MKPVRAALLALLLVGCAKRESGLDAAIEPPPAADDGACRRYQVPPREVGKAPAELPELSGLAASHTHPGVYWAHNDSGNATELFAVRDSGEIVARFPLDANGLTADDAEDLAVGPCGPDDPAECVYLGDIGDNLGWRKTVRIFKVREPAELSDATLAAEVLAFRYPDGAHNAESLILNRKDSALYVVTKTDESLGEVFRLAGLTASGVATAVKVGALHSRNRSDHTSTAADLHPTAPRLLVRTYGHVWELRGPAGASVEELLNAEAVELPYAPSQPQSEAIAYTADGRGYLIGSEGAGTPLVRVDCVP